MATKIQIWNKALRLLGLPRIAGLTDNVETRYELTDAWSTVPMEVMEAGYWPFSILTTTLSGTTSSLIPGYTHRHTLPADWLRTIGVATSSDFNASADHRTESGYLYAQSATVYLRYLSSTKAGDSYVADWSPSFTEAVSMKLALAIAPVLKPGDQQAMQNITQMYADQIRRAMEAAESNKHDQHRSPDTRYLLPLRESVVSAQGGR